MHFKRFGTRTRIAADILLSAALICGLSLTGCKKDNNFHPIETTTLATTEATTTAEPTATLTPTPSPTPSPSPTPVPRYVEPTIKEVWYDGYVDPRSIRATIVENPEESVTTLVNKYYALDESYVPSDLVACNHSANQQLRREAAEAYDELYTAVKDATGTGIYLVSGYRSYQIQIGLFQRSCNTRSVPFACKRNALQGRSEHQLGLAIDICPEGQTRIWDDFGETTPGKWINEHCYEYGFIRRFQGKFSDETGYDNEAWHYRYVGVELATYLYENDMSLEAYYGKQQILPGDE